MLPITIPVTQGTLERYELFPASAVPPRTVDVWLPPHYQPGGRYAVLYMHDGQNLFLPGYSYGGVPWNVHIAAADLMAQQRIPELIIVGVWNIGRQRWGEYLPQKPAETPAGRTLSARFPGQLTGPLSADAYLRFLVGELKPFMDDRYPTEPGPAQTVVMGSSMGGLISLYALTEYPQIFGGAGCVSTHWVAGEQLLVDYFAGAVPAPGLHQLYFDYGTETADAAYEPWQQRLDAHLAQAGYTLHRDWLTRKFPGAEHSERAWSQRVHIPLEFLFNRR